MYKKNLALNDLQWLICHRTKPNLFSVNLVMLRSHIHEYAHVQNRHVMFITIEYIKNRNLKNTKLLLVQVQNLFI